MPRSFPPRSGLVLCTGSCTPSGSPGLRVLPGNPWCIKNAAIRAVPLIRERIRAPPPIPGVLIGAHPPRSSLPAVRRFPLPAFRLRRAPADRTSRTPEGGGRRGPGIQALRETHGLFPDGASPAFSIIGNPQTPVETSEGLRSDPPGRELTVIRSGRDRGLFPLPSGNGSVDPASWRLRSGDEARLRRWMEANHSSRTIALATDHALDIIRRFPDYPPTAVSKSDLRSGYNHG